MLAFAIIISLITPKSFACTLLLQIKKIKKLEILLFFLLQFPIQLKQMGVVISLIHHQIMRDKHDPKKSDGWYQLIDYYPKLYYVKFDCNWFQFIHSLLTHFPSIRCYIIATTHPNWWLVKLISPLCPLIDHSFVEHHDLVIHDFFSRYFSGIIWTIHIYKHKFYHCSQWRQRKNVFSEANFEG